MIFTVGYGNRTLEAFISLLKKYEIAYLIDVRSHPYSRFNPDFSQQALATALEAHSIYYLFLGKELGGKPADTDCYTASGLVDYDKVQTKEFYQAGIQRLIKAEAGNHRIALMCSEIKPEECHRSKLIGETLHALSIEALHITENGELKQQREVIFPRQINLFGEISTLTSKGRYLNVEQADNNDEN